MEEKVVIIGSGIAGMSSAIYLKRAGIDPLIIEKEVAGGQLHKANVIENYPGFEKISGPDLAFNIYNQVKKLDVRYLYDGVINITKEDTIIIKTKKEEIKTKYLIIATGRAPRKLNLENEERLIGKGISYCALCDGSLYKNKDVVVIGGGNSAIEDAIYLANICNKVSVIHRRNNLRAEDKLVEQLKEFPNTQIIYDNEVVEYITNEDKLTKVKLKDNREIKADGVFIAIGYEPIANMLKLENDNNYIIVDSKMHTSLPNVYAIGDAIKKDVYQLVTAANEGVIAAVDIIKHEKSNL